MQGNGASPAAWASRPLENCWVQLPLGHSSLLGVFQCLPRNTTTPPRGTRGLGTSGVGARGTCSVQPAPARLPHAALRARGRTTRPLGGCPFVSPTPKAPPDCHPTRPRAISAPRRRFLNTSSRLSDSRTVVHTPAPRPPAADTWFGLHHFAASLGLFRESS